MKLTFLAMSGLALGFIFVGPLALNFVTERGQFARKLCLINSAGWLLILAIATGPDTIWLAFTFAVFWTSNLILLPAALYSLKAGYIDREENQIYLATTLTYLLLNMLVLFFLPLLWFVLQVIG